MVDKVQAPDEELVLSDVHMDTCPPGQRTWLTRFMLLQQDVAASTASSCAEQGSAVDELVAWPCIAPPAQAVPAPQHGMIPVSLTADQGDAGKEGEPGQWVPFEARQLLMDADGDLDVERKTRQPASQPCSLALFKQQRHDLPQQQQRNLQHEHYQQQRHQQPWQSSMTSIDIKHQLATPLAAVGTQVWRGACLLADLVMNQQQALVRGKTVVELGSGVGLVSIAAAWAGAQSMYCTDHHTQALQLAAENILLNSQQLASGLRERVHVRALDWLDFMGFAGTDAEPRLYAALLPDGAISGQDSSQGGPKHQWTSTDLLALQQASILLAADVVYDDVLTEAFLCCAAAIMSYAAAHGSCPRMFVALEKRWNFTLRDLDARASAFEHFVSLLQTDPPAGGPPMAPCVTHDNPAPGQSQLLRGRRLAVDVVPQLLAYDRGPDLELWELSLNMGSKN